MRKNSLELELHKNRVKLLRSKEEGLGVTRPMKRRATESLSEVQ
jgi:hypothetical protein